MSRRRRYRQYVRLAPATRLARVHGSCHSRATESEKKRLQHEGKATSNEWSARTHTRAACPCLASSSLGEYKTRPALALACPGATRPALRADTTHHASVTRPQPAQRCCDASHWLLMRATPPRVEMDLPAGDRAWSQAALAGNRWAAFSPGPQRPPPRTLAI